MNHALHLDAVSTGYGKTVLVRDLTLALPKGEVLNILGPNGVGKTTLLKAICGLGAPLAGKVQIFGHDLMRLPIRERARKIALVSQSENMTFALSVLETVLTGRAAHLGLFAQPSARDKELAMAMLAEMGIADLADRDMPSLSGGQRQMVRIARALVQEAEIMVLDEPTAHLDIANQMQVLAAVRRLHGRGMTIIITTHDPEHALVCGGQVLALGKDRAPVIGAAEDVLDEALLENLFSVPVTRLTTPAGDTLIAPRYRDILSGMTT